MPTALAHSHWATAHRLGLGLFTIDGAFFAKVDGRTIGEDGRCFWPTRNEALAAAARFAAKLAEVERRA